MAKKLYGYWITRENERVSVDILPPAQAWRGDVMLDGHRPDRRKEGAFHLQPSGRWAIIRPGREPFELGLPIPPDATYVFKDALVQDASYASLVRGRRQHCAQNG